MAKPLMPVEVIHRRALTLLDAEGVAALTMRRLASELGISTSTLYQQVGSREQLIRALVARHFSELRLHFRALDTWEETAQCWCETLRDVLYAHPFLTELMTIEDRDSVISYMNELLTEVVREGIPRQLAIECCRALVNFTISHTFMEVRGRAEPKPEKEPSAESAALIEKSFSQTISWILAGVRQQASASRARKRTDACAG